MIETERDREIERERERERERNTIYVNRNLFSNMIASIPLTKSFLSSLYGEITKLENYSKPNSLPPAKQRQRQRSRSWKRDRLMVIDTFYNCPLRKSKSSLRFVSFPIYRFICLSKEFIVKGHSILFDMELAKSILGLE